MRVSLDFGFPYESTVRLLHAKIKNLSLKLFAEFNVGIPKFIKTIRKSEIYINFEALCIGRALMKIINSKR